MLLASLVFTNVLAGQQLLHLDQNGDDYLGPGDFAVLASDEERDDLPCDVEALDPELEYDLSFRAGYNARIALRALTGRGNSLRFVFRITPLDTAQDPVYMQRRIGYPISR
jgi:hypothetical protein